MADDHRVSTTGQQRAAGAVQHRPVVDWPPHDPGQDRASRPSPGPVPRMAADLRDLTQRRGRRPESLAALLAPEPPPTPPALLDLRLRPLIRVENMAVSLRFYSELGAEVIHGGPDTDYVLLQLGVVQIGLLARDPNPLTGAGDVQLTFSTSLPLDQLEERLRAAGILLTEVGDEELEIRSPDGLLIRFTERDPDPYV